MRDTYHPLFDAYGVDLVLQAHNHYYERTYPIVYNPFNFSSPLIASHALSQYQEGSGPIFLTVGTGGSDLHKYKQQREYSANDYEGSGFLEIMLLGEGNSMQVTYHAIDGEIDDQFNLTKNIEIKTRNTGAIG